MLGHVAYLKFTNFQRQLLHPSLYVLNMEAIRSSATALFDYKSKLRHISKQNNFHIYQTTANSHNTTLILRKLTLYTPFCYATLLAAISTVFVKIQRDWIKRLNVWTRVSVYSTEYRRRQLPPIVIFGSITSINVKQNGFFD